MKGLYFKTTLVTINLINALPDGYPVPNFKTTLVTINLIQVRPRREWIEISKQLLLLLIKQRKV